MTGTKFLFGGNIRDPLNLNALSHEEIERRRSDSLLQAKKFEGKHPLKVLYCCFIDFAYCYDLWQANNSWGLLTVEVPMMKSKTIK
jgi:hypothetical protein